jgi:hypothetical protein
MLPPLATMGQPLAIADCRIQVVSHEDAVAGDRVGSSTVTHGSIGVDGLARRRGVATVRYTVLA